MLITLLLNFNNYFNRDVKKFETLNEYKTASEYHFDVQVANFNPNDSVNTTLVLNVEELGSNCDYLIVSEDDKIQSRWFILEARRERNGQYTFTLQRDVIVDNYDAVMTAPTFVQKGMITNINNNLLLNKEGMNYNQIKQSERLLKDKSNCAWVVAYIPSDFATTEDKTVSSTIPYTGSQDYTVDGIENWEYYKYVNPSPTLDNFTLDGVDIEATANFSTTIRGYNVVAGRCKVFNYKPNEISTESRDSYWLDTNNTYSFVGWNGPDPAGWNNIAKDANGDKKTDFIAIFHQLMINNHLMTSDYDKLRLLYNNKVIYDTKSGKYYQISLELNSTVSAISRDQLSEIGFVYYDSFKTWWGRNYSNNFSKTQQSYYQKPFDVSKPIRNVYRRSFKISLTEKVSTIEAKILSNRYHLTDSPYDMICIPYGDNVNIYKNGTLYISNANKLAAMRIATDLAADLGTGAIYDVQLLPYCPMQSIIESGKIDFGSLIASDIISGSTKLNTIFYCSTSSFDLTIPMELSIPYSTEEERTVIDSTPVNLDNEELRYIIPYEGTGQIEFQLTDYISFSPDEEILSARLQSISAYNIQVNNPTMFLDGTRCVITFETNQPDDGYDNFTISISVDYQYSETYEVFTSTDVKLSNECDLYRLTSPNYSGQFDFSIAKLSNKRLYSFNVDCTYRPFQPYIHIAPNFSGLYGTDFDDARGLICGGDFSLPQLSNAWSNYVLHNKNYDIMFNRQMENLDINNKYQQQNDIMNAISGGIQGVASGAMVGSAGGIPGAIIGGIAGGAASIAGGAADISRNAALRRENKQYQIDMYNYNLQNVQAIPTSLTKVGAYTRNNKIFPVLEYYSCTYEEKQALRNKIKYEGMTIMTIGTPGEYEGTGFFKGEIIKIPELENDYHMSTAIYNEISKGVYL